MEPISPRSSQDPISDGAGHADEGRSQDPGTSSKIEQMPKEIGVLLLATGMITGILPPPPGPFDLSLMLAGGVALWPRSLRPLEGWARRRFPGAHRAAMSFLDRYLDDLERRYPGATSRCAPPADTPADAAPPLRRVS